ncbi:MAG: hypothetical protein HKN01_08625, partial [Acidimicrobiia bacterium]|nr:hypothetical protein [Acidimicrobiia bacterium]
NNGTNNNTGYTSNSPQLDYLVNFTQVGTHYVWIRGQGPASTDDSLHVGLNGVGRSTSDRITGFSRSGWSWSSDTMDSARATIEVTTPGEQMLNIWMREDGRRIDKIVLTTESSLNPTSFGATGPAESPRGPPQPALQFSESTESFSVAEGETALQTATVSLDTSDASAASYSLSSSYPSWLTVSPASGTTPEGSITITADPSGLVAGDYTGSITASSAAYVGDSIDVTLTVVGASTGFQQDPTTGLLSIEVENADTNTPQGGHSWSPYPSGSASGGSGLEATPNNGTNNNTGYTSNSPRLDYLVNFTQVGTHYIWVRGQGPTGSDDSLHVGLNGAGQSTSDRVTGFGSGWSWSSDTMDSARATIEVTAPGEQMLNIWMREDGTRIDKIMLTTDSSLNPTSFGAMGPAESPRGPPQPALQFSATTESFSVAEGETTLQTATVSLDTSDASAVSYSLSSSAPSWLSVNPASGTTPEGSITITADPSGLLAGVYAGSITASATGYLGDAIDVTLTITGTSTGYQQDPTTGLLSIEVENADTNTPQGGHSWSPYPSGGASGGSGLEATPNNGTNNNTGYTSNSPQLDYLVNFTQVGTHYVWIR